ncbi:MAG TPA: 3-hydroxyacyl-CoA dehydrogenase NAD-binding domain-containing protein, partial [Holophagaceae bacterium]|nr:3-hydroxyacyl-CoA dehydrogenase NAD-binding domain-containing protein [Holophagaceae bacterium]
MDIRSIGVVGCGLMGAGIAQVAAERGFEVKVKEVDQAALDKGLARIHGAWDRAESKGKLTPEAKAAQAARIHGTLSFHDLGGCQLVIEAVPELLDLKLKAFADLDRAMAPSAILCSNTSSLPIGRLGGALTPDRTGKLAGLHFFNPVPAMPLVEIIRTVTTDASTVDALRGFVSALGKTPILAPDAPGFVVNRLLVPYLLDAARCAEQRLATVEDIDSGMKLGCGHPMGPLHLCDFIG